ncbi:unnamed protein product [Arctogadus glacialis]
MLINMSPSGSTMEEKLSSIMDVLAKAAVSEISQLFSEGSATLQLQITQSREENEALRTRMKEMRSELFSLRLQTRSKASGEAIRFALTRDNICKPETTSLGNGLKPLMDHKAVGHSPFHLPSKKDCDAFGDRSTQSAATLESLQVDAAGSSHVSSQNAELRILSVYAQGGGQLVMEGHDTLFTASEVEALNSLSADCSVAQSLDCGERMDCRKQLAVQVENSPSHLPSKSEAYSVTTPAHTIESTHLYDLSLVVIDNFSVKMQEYVECLCVSLLMWKAGDPRQLFERGGRGYWWILAPCRRLQ